MSAAVANILHTFSRYKKPFELGKRGEPGPEQHRESLGPILVRAQNEQIVGRLSRNSLHTSD
jgi:hypothetical protein